MKDSSNTWIRSSDETSLASEQRLRKMSLTFSRFPFWSRSVELTVRTYFSLANTVCTFRYSFKSPWKRSNVETPIATPPQH